MHKGDNQGFQGLWTFSESDLEIVAVWAMVAGDQISADLEMQ